MQMLEQNFWKATLDIFQKEGVKILYPSSFLNNISFLLILRGWDLPCTQLLCGTLYTMLSMKWEIELKVLILETKYPSIQVVFQPFICMT